jgi:prohibitin 2
MNVKGGSRIPAPPPGASALVKVAVFGGAAVYAAMNSLYNVEGGHRAIVFNRIQGIKDKVWTPRARPLFSPLHLRIFFNVRLLVGLGGSDFGLVILMVRLGKKCSCWRCVEVNFVLTLNLT